MTNETQLPEGWKRQKNPPGLIRTYQFETYTETSQFLDNLADISEKLGFYPNLNFTRTQVNVSIGLEPETEDFTQTEYDFVNEAELLLTSTE